MNGSLLHDRVRSQNTSMELIHSVDIYPYFDAFNQSFFLHCLETVFGSRRLRFTKHGFPRFRNSGSLKAIIRGKQATRVFIDHWDLPLFDTEGLEWCDVYAKRNIDPDAIPQAFVDKIVPAGPSFPVRMRSLPRTVSGAVFTFFASSGASIIRNPPTLRGAREHFANWLGQYVHRPSPQAYRPGRSSPDYVFFIGTLWKKDPAANSARANFIRACKSIPGLRFEGGFARRAGFDEYADVMVDAWYSQEQYLEKTSASAVVFNNPAVSHCHSWRLGEALALGKAIVSLPPERLLPETLTHGENVHLVELSFDSMREAVQRLTHDDAYRARLEAGSIDYYRRRLTPRPVIERVCGLDSSSFVSQLGIKLNS